MIEVLPRAGVGNYSLYYYCHLIVIIIVIILKLLLFDYVTVRSLYYHLI